MCASWVICRWTHTVFVPQYEKPVFQAWLNTHKQLVLEDSLLMRIQPSLRDRFVISLLVEKTILLLNVYPNEFQIRFLHVISLD